MKNPLDSVGTTVTLGVLFAIVVMVLPNTPGGEFSHLSLGRWAHIVTGIFWIGLLYYFNVAQIPALAAANQEERARARLRRDLERQPAAGDLGLAPSESAVELDAPVEQPHPAFKTKMGAALAHQRVIIMAN